MTTSSDRDALVALSAALVKAQAAFTVVQKNSKVTINNNFSFKYAALDDVVAMVKPILKANGLAVLQFPSHDGEGRSTLTTYLLHEGGGWISHDMLLIGVGSDPKAQGAAITYARRYALCAALGIVADEDVDAPPEPPAAPPPAPAPTFATDPDRIEEVFAKASKVSKDDAKDGPYITAVRSEVRRVLDLGPEVKITPTKIRLWIDAGLEEAEEFVDTQLELIGAADAAE